MGGGVKKHCNERKCRNYSRIGWDNRAEWKGHFIIRQKCLVKRFKIDVGKFWRCETGLGYLKWRAVCTGEVKRCFIEVVTIIKCKSENDLAYNSNVIY